MLYDLFKISDLLLGYVTSVLEDARTFSEHAGRKAIRTDDVKLSVMMQLDKVFASPPPRDVCEPFFFFYLLYFNDLNR